MLRVTGYEFYPNMENLVLWASGSPTARRARSETNGYTWKYNKGVLEYWRTVEDPAVSGGVLE